MAIEQSERRDCNDSALNCHGTGYIFEQRLVPLRVASKILTFSSLAGPLAIGALVIAVGSEGKMITWAVWSAGIFSFFQILISFWAVVAGWQQKISAYEGAMVENFFLADKFKQLADSTALSDTKWRNEVRVLESRGDIRRQEDLKHGVSDEEKRMAMRYALRHFSRRCGTCEKLPDSVLPQTDDYCNVCSNFKIKRIKWLS